MKADNRRLLHAIGRHSDLDAAELDGLLKAEAYSTPVQWYRFIRLSLISLGAGFLLAGVVFFFAYNWDGLHKFVKLGIVAGLLTGCVIAAWMIDPQSAVHKVLLFAASLLTGVLFAVYGQIYQTGADAFDFFLAWTVFTVIWVWVSDFPPLWLAFLVLMNLALASYMDLEGRLWPSSTPFVIHALLNAIVLIATYAKGNMIGGTRVPGWVTHTVAISVVFFLTAGIVTGIFGPYNAAFPLLLAIAFLLYPWAVHQGIRTQSIFLPALVSLSLIVIATVYLIQLSQGYFMSLFISLFVLGSVSMVTYLLLSLQKKWSHA
jgi:uncharacterized membrane protein